MLSQCDNLLLMRMNSEADLGHLSDAFLFVPDSLIQRATTFRQGESLVAGKFVPHPTYVRFGGCRRRAVPTYRPHGQPRGGECQASWKVTPSRSARSSRLSPYVSRATMP